jgi:hypothetical protein
MQPFGFVGRRICFYAPGDEFIAQFDQRPTPFLCLQVSSSAAFLRFCLKVFS